MVGRIFAPIWEGTATVLGWTYLVAVSITMAVWAVRNFLCDEASHDLDFYSNRLRTRPYWYGMIFLAFLGMAVAMGTSEEMFGLVFGKFPELLVAMHLQALIVLGTLLRYESSAAAIAGMALSSLANIAAALIVTIPELPFQRPGMTYANAFLFVNIVGVLWITVGVRRYFGRDGNPKLLPQGAERMPELSAQAILLGNPLLLALLDFLFAVLWQIEQENYAPAFTISYGVVTTCLVLGCCKSFRTATEVEE